MIGVVLALVGIACLVYSMLVVAIAFGGLIAVVWQLLRAIRLQIFLLFPRLREHSNGSARSAKATERLNRFHAESTHPSPRRPKLGNDIAIIAGDQTSGKALYSEVDQPPRAKLSEN